MSVVSTLIDNDDKLKLLTPVDPEWKESKAVAHKDEKLEEINGAKDEVTKRGNTNDAKDHITDTGNEKSQ